jgi:hypothetical protein
MKFGKYLLEENIFLTMKPDDFVTKTNINLQREYDNLNKSLFNNELEKYPLKWSNRKGVGGTTVSTGVKNKPSTWVLKHIEISLYYETTYGDFLNVLAHEMIHVKLTQEKTSDPSGGHGIFFKSEMNRINQMNKGIKITNKMDLTNKAPVKTGGKIKHVAVAMIKFSNEKGIVVYNFKNISRILETFRAYPAAWYIDKTIYFVKSDDIRLSKYPVKRSQSGNFGYYTIDDATWNEIKSQGRSIETL